MSSDSGHRSTTIAVAVRTERTSQLVHELFRRHTLVAARAEIPEEADICLVDEATLGGLADALRDWRRTASPVFAPVVLLGAAASATRQVEDADPSPTIDAILEADASTSTLVNRVETFLEMREFSTRLGSEDRPASRLFDTSPLAKVIVDAEGAVQRANDRTASLLGCPAADLEGMTLLDGPWMLCDRSGEPIPEGETPLARVLRNGRPLTGFECRLDRPDDETVWLSVDMAPIRDEAGAVAFVVGSLDDVTVRREQERELERQFDLFRKAQSIADVGAWEYDVRHDSGHWSDEVYRIHGLDPESTDTIPPTESLEYYHPEDRPKIRAAFERAVTTGEPYDLELRLVDADGDLRWVRTRGEPQLLDGEVVRVRGSLQEVTERVERERQLQRLDRYLRHNLRNKLNVVQGMAALVRQDGDPAVAEYAETINETTADLLSNVAKERELTKLLREDPTKRPIELMGLLDGIVDDLETVYPGTTFRLTGPDRVCVLAIEQLRLALEEVLTNAVEHNDRPQPDVTVDVSAGPDAVTVRVTDDGPGIPQMEVDVVTGLETASELYHGAGVGLWLVAMLVKRSGGSIEFEDREPSGTAVLVTLAPVEDC